MARYDRIALLPAPSREHALPGWAVLRDLEGRERDTDLSRRLRLRFLALRAAKRLARRGHEEMSEESLERQIETVREELGQLSPRDPERALLASFLHRLNRPTPLSVTTATLELGEMAEMSGHLHGAEEFYRTAIDFADQYRLTAEQMAARLMMGRVWTRSARWEEAEVFFREGAELALRLDDRGHWARAMGGVAKALAEQSRPSEARRVCDEMLACGKEWSDPIVQAEAWKGLCEVALAAGDLESAVGHGWTALESAESGEQRDETLALLGIAFTRLGLYRAAERCHTLVVQRATRPRLQTRSRLELARIAAYAGKPDAAREHLRKAMEDAGEHGDRDLLGSAEDLLSALERAAEQGISPPTHAPVGERARKIAEQAESLTDEPVAASS